MRSLDRIFRRNKPNLKPLAQWVKGLFSTGVNGAWYDPSDIRLDWRRNLLTYTEQFDNAAWTKSATTVTANAVTAPDGTLTADKLVENAATAQHVLQSSSVITTSGSVYVASAYVKAVEVQYAQIGIDGANYSSVTFDVVNGVFLRTNYVGANQYVAGSAQIVSVGNGWFRVSAAFTASATSYFTVKLNRPNINTQDPSYPGDGTSGIYIWGAQLELGSTATSYQRITDGIKDYLDYKPLPILYQDATGTTPVTAVGQPVGLMLDKSKGLVLGPELVTNGDFSQGTTGWLTLAGWSISSGQGVATATSGALYQQNVAMATSKWYLVTFDVTVASGAVYVITGSRQGPSRATSGKYSAYLSPSSGSNQIEIWGSGFTGTVDNISVRELPGNHAYNPSGNSANFPVLSARYNLLTKTEQFDDAVWGKTGTSVTPNTVVAPNGTLTSDKLVEDTSNGVHVITQAATISAGVTYVFSVYLKAAERSKGRVMASSLGSLVNVDLASGTLSGGSGPGYVSSNILDVGGGWYNVVLTYIESTSGSRSHAIYLEDDGGNTYYQGNGTSGIYIWGADLRVANDALNQPAYQRVNTATDYDTVGFKPYLSFNGVNQWLQTNSLDFTYGDKMFVSAGVRKLSDATIGVVIETSVNSNSNNGAIWLLAPGSPALDQYSFRSKGTSASDANVTGYAAPITNVLSDIGNISGDQSILRINGTQVVINTADQGAGNYGNYPMYIGARAGTSLWFNGRLYGLVVAGKQASAGEITSCERYLNQKTGAWS